MSATAPFSGSTTSTAARAAAGKKRAKQTGRGRGGSFVALPHSVICSPEFAALDGWAVKLLIDLLASYKGNNNGDLALTWKMAKARGWRSPATLQAAKQRLLDARFIVVSRQGARNNVCTLFAVTFFAIDACKGKLEIEPTHAPLALWKRFSQA